jgi:SP family facilitated glucose transporter-like MFS transporter 3
MSSGIVKREGVKGGLIWTGYTNILGVLLMSLAPSWIVLALGRYALLSLGRTIGTNEV